MNAQWLGDILLGNFEALRQVQCSRYTAFNLPDPFAPSPHLVVNLLGEWLRGGRVACVHPPPSGQSCSCLLRASTFSQRPFEMGRDAGAWLACLRRVARS